MMNFSDVVNDLKKLEGIRLNSIRPGAEITITEVDLEQKKVLVRSKNGKTQSRSYVEFQRIWEALMSKPVVRVEEVLNGSGSSRNQPETIFANLPYIEWLKIDNKKHIVYVDKSTHAYGTLKQMDSIQAMQLMDKVEKNGLISEHLILISSDSILAATDEYSKICGTEPIALSKGVYLYSSNEQTMVFVDSNATNIPAGTYFSVASNVRFDDISFELEIKGAKWGLVNCHHFKVITKLQ